jgi:hypothetical protein
MDLIGSIDGEIYVCIILVYLGEFVNTHVHNLAAN